MSEAETSLGRQNKRNARIIQKTLQEYDSYLAELRQRADYLPEYEYFLDLVKEPINPEVLAQRIQKPLVAVFCIHTPWEILEALGLHGVKLVCGSQSIQRAASSRLPVLMCPMLKSLISSMTLDSEGANNYKAVVLPTTCDWVVKMPEILGQELPNLHYLELPHVKDTEKSARAWQRELQDLVGFLEKISGKSLTATALKQAIESYEELWSNLEELKELKRQGKISSVWYTLVNNSFMLDTRERWAEALRELLRTLEKKEPVGQGPKVFMAGSPIVFPNLKLLQLVEQAGMQVIADDLCSSERILPGAVLSRDNTVQEMLRALADRYHKGCSCPTFANNERRINNILWTAKENEIKGVVYNVLKGCHPFDIEAITIEGGLKEQGLKYIKLETDYGPEDSQNLLTRLEAFGQTL